MKKGATQSSKLAFLKKCCDFWRFLQDLKLFEHRIQGCLIVFRSRRTETQ